jgi:Ser/Thr protein kinase RdoA (MazF antagonist)
MARLQEISDAWQHPPGFSRTSWDRNGLLGDAPVWGRFWENPTLSPEDRDLMRAFRRAADAELATLEPSLDFGLIHAELVRETVLINGDEIQLIDFDDGGFGFRLFDLATTLGKLRDEPDVGDLKAALIDGYRSVRPLETTHLDLFMALRAATYVGWIIPRMAEDGAAARNTRFIEAATALARNWMMTARPA